MSAPWYSSSVALADIDPDARKQSKQNKKRRKERAANRAKQIRASQSTDNAKKRRARILWRQFVAAVEAGTFKVGGMITLDDINDAGISIKGNGVIPRIQTDLAANNAAYRLIHKGKLQRRVDGERVPKSYITTYLITAARPKPAPRLKPEN